VHLKSGNERVRALIVGALIAFTPSRVALAQSTVTLLDYKTSVRVGWTARKPASTMRLAEYTVAGLDSASGGAEVVVYFFGPGQGGNVEANLARWKSQFSTPDGSPVPTTITRDSSGAFPITFAEYRGTYARGVGAGDAAQAKPGQMLIAGVAETPRGTMFIQLFGPAARVAAEREKFVAFVKGLRE